MSGSIFDMLTDPTTSALMGLAQGFGQSAMPTRMPTPIGAVLGQGIGGLQQGLATGQALRKGDIQNQQAKIGLDFYKNMAGPQGGGGQGQNVAFGAPQVDSNGNYMVSPRYLSQLATMLAGTGKDPTGALRLLESYATGGMAMDQSGNAFAIPGAANARGQLGYATKFGEKSGEFAAPSKPEEVTVPDGKGGFRKQLMTPQQQREMVTGGSTEAAQPTDPRTAAVNAMNSIPDPKVRAMVANSIFKHGLPVEAVAPFIAGIHHESGWNPDVKNGSSGEIGLGQVMPDTGKMLGYTPEQLRDPQTNLDASVKYFNQKWTESKGSIPGAYAGYNTGSVSGTPTTGYLEDTSSRLAKYGYPGVSVPRGSGTQVAGPGAPTSGFAPLTPVPGAPVIVPAGQQAGAPLQPGGPPVPRDASGFPLGNAAPVQIPPTTPIAAPMAGAPMAGVPGMPALTPQQEAALKVQTANQMPVELRTGGMQVQKDAQGNPTSIIKNPEHITIENGDGTKTVGHIEPPPPTAPPGTQGTFVPIARIDQSGRTIAPEVGNAVPADVQAARTHLVNEFHGKDTDSYVAAKNTHAWLNQIDRAADAMNAAGGIYNTGPYAASRVNLMQGINDVGRSMGLGSPFSQDTLSNAEELRKATTTAGFELSSHYEGHARQAASTIENATSAVPGMSNSPQGVKLVSAGIREGAQSAIDSHEYRQSRLQGADPYNLNPQAAGKKAGAGLETAETDFYKKFTPEMYSTRAISTVHPVTMTAKSLEEFNTQAQKYLPGTQVILNGQPKIIPPRPDAPPISPYIQNRFMQPQATPHGG